MKKAWLAGLVGAWLLTLAIPASAQRSSDDQYGRDDSSDRSSSRDEDRSSRSGSSRNDSSRNSGDDSSGRQGSFRKQSRSRDEAAGEGVRGFIKRHDSDNDGYLSRSEIPKDMRNDFNDLDRDGDGYLSRKELQQHAREAMREASMPVDVTYVWVLDANAGHLDPQDLQDAYDVLKKIDKDHDGRISQKELRDRREHVVSQWCDKCFSQLDEDGDGELSQSEAQDTTFGEEFDKFDSNQDGALTKSEIHRQLQNEFESQSAQRPDDQTRR